MERSRSWCFTLNNYTPADITTVDGLEAAYKVYGKEVGANGTPHLQGYVYFKSARTLSAISKKLPRCHLEIAKGDGDQNYEYCTKDGDFVESGIRPLSQKKKGDAGKRVYEEAFELAKAGRFEEIPEPLRTRFYSTYKKIRSDYQIAPASMSQLDFRWYYGDTGTGKSLASRTEFPQAYLKKPNKWWDGYVDQECVIIDEWAPDNEVTAAELKKWADHHAFAAEVKGGSLCIRPKTIIITSNYSMEDCFTKHENLAPLKRRFKVRRFGYGGAVHDEPSAKIN